MRTPYLLVNSSLHGGMGTKLSKPSIIHEAIVEKSYEAEKQLGRDIIYKISLKTTNPGHKEFQQFKDTKFAKRLEMDSQTEGTVDWTDIPNLFSQPPTTEARKIVQKCFKLLAK